MRVLIVHNQLWAHYKSKLFCELYQQAPQFGLSVHVAQIALAEKSRLDMGQAESIAYLYDYEVLFDDALENISTWQRSRALLAKIRRYRPQVLNLTGYYDPAQWVLLFYAKLTGIKVIISSESNVRDGSRSFLKEKLKQFILYWADGFFCFGQSSATYLEKLGVNPAKIWTRKAAVVDNDLIRARYEIAYGERIKQKQILSLPRYNFIFVGRLIAPKNLLVLLKAFANLSQPSEWGLIFLGEGEQKVELQDFCQQNELSNVSFLAGVEWHKVPEYLALADVLVLPSTSEPWGLVVNEAMVCGLPVVVSEVCGCVEDLLIDGQNGFVFNPNDTDELTQKLRFFVENPAQLVPMGDASRQLVAPFETHTVAAQMLESIVDKL